MSGLAADYTIEITDEMTYGDLFFKVRELIASSLLQEYDEVRISPGVDELSAPYFGNPTATIKKKGRSDVLIRFEGYPQYDRDLLFLSCIFRKDELKKAINSKP
jgi:hypothetical protein